MYKSHWKISAKNRKLYSRMQAKSKASMRAILEKHTDVILPTEGLSERFFVAHDIHTKRRSKWQLKMARDEFSFLRISPEYITWRNSQENICRYCSKRVPSNDIHIDHIIPLAKWGSNDISNLCISCSRCNRKKSDKIYVLKEGEYINE